MRQNNKFIGVAALATVASLTAMGGNIPQYEFRQTDSEFVFLKDAIPVNVSYLTEGANQLYYLGDRAYINAYTGQGYPIGFDFKYAGQTFNQFAIDNTGSIMLGKDHVENRGYLGLLYKDPTIYEYNSFYFGMTPINSGIQYGEVSYKTEGEEGNRTLTVQYAHMEIKSGNPRGAATYSEQIVLHEKDGRIEINFLEEATPYQKTGFHIGLAGWDYNDQKILKSEGIGKPFTVSEYRQADQLNNETIIQWDTDDELGYHHMTPYSYTLSFTPTGESGFTCASPEDLAAEQTADMITASCRRPADAPATMILWSETPFDDSEIPAEGLTYEVKNHSGEYGTKIGNATVIYYGDDENPTATVKNVKPATPYYIKAFGVNGYPSYSTSSASTIDIYSSHPAPTLFRATSAGNAIELQTVAEQGDKVIIAVTEDRVESTTDTPLGIFGTPAADCKAGDKIEGGGIVIYVGDPGTFSYDDAKANRQLFFRTWAIRDGRVSKTFNNTSGVTDPQFPYIPEVEQWALFLTPTGWLTSTSSTDQATMTEFVPRMHGQNMDVPVIGGISALGTTSSIMTPAIDIQPDSKLSFEWAMETTREPVQGDDQLVVLPEGNEPGKFGMGHTFSVTCGTRGTGTTLLETSQYDGTMTESTLEPGRYISGTSTFISETVEIPEGRGMRVKFSFSTEGFSILYLRNISIDNGQVGIESIAGNMVSEDIITSGHGFISIMSAAGGEYSICSLDGRVARTLKLGEGEVAAVTLDKGIYIVGGRKIAVK